MPVRLNSSGGGSVTLDVPSTAGTFTATVPANTGTLVTTGSTAAVTPAMLTQPLTLATAQNSTSGTSIDFTGIPSWVRRLTVMFNGVSLNGSSHLLIQVGAGSITTTGYAAAGNYLQGGVGSGGLSSTSGFPIYAGFSSNVQTGCCTLNLLTANTWIASGVTAFENQTINGFTAGRVSLAGALDRVRITTVNGTDTFDAGSVNIMYEG